MLVCSKWSLAAALLGASALLAQQCGGSASTGGGGDGGSSDGSGSSGGGSGSGGGGSSPGPDAGDASTNDAGSQCGVDAGACCPNSLNRLPCDTGLMCCQGVPYPASGACLPACTLRSDRNLKRDIKPVQEQAVLDAVSRMPVSTWSYKTEEPSVRHMGPMAQDFKAAFGLGDTDKTYNAIDAHGVAFAAIKALHAQVREQSARIERLEQDNEQLRARCSSAP